MEALVTAGLSLVTVILQLISRAVAGDRVAQDKLRRVEEVLKPSPTERAWAEALKRGEAKPSRDLAPPPIPREFNFTGTQDLTYDSEDSEDGS